MANRNLNFTPNVTRVVPELPDSTGLGFAEVAAQIAASSAESKLVANTAKVQVELKKLDSQFRLQYAHDPENADGLKALAENRSAVIEQYGSEVPLVLRGTWQQKTTDLSTQSSASNELWAVEQNYTNTVNNVNSSIGTYLGAAGEDGRAFGASKSSDLTAILGYSNARQELESFGVPNLGQQKTQDLLKTFNDDYIKSFVSGVIESNPQKGVELLDNDVIRKSMTPEQYTKFRSSAEGRARAVARNIEQGGVLRTISNGNKMLADGGTNMSYADLQDADLSEEARSYFESLNGFQGTGKRGGFTPEDKAGYQMAIFDAVAKMKEDKNMDAASLRVVQDHVYRAMNKGAITQAEGLEYIKQIVDPFVAQKQQEMEKFGERKWFGDSFGLEGVDKFYEDNVQKPVENLNKDTRRSVEASNAVNKSNLYQYYWEGLVKEADARGMTVADLNVKLNLGDRGKVYAAAQTYAQESFLKDRHPSLRTLPDLPNYVLSGGKMIQGMAGPRNVKPVATVAKPFQEMRHKKTGEVYRVYPNGKIEKAPQ